MLNKFDEVVTENQEKLAKSNDVETTEKANNEELEPVQAENSNAEGSKAEVLDVTEQTEETLEEKDAEELVEENIEDLEEVNAEADENTEEADTEEKVEDEEATEDVEEEQAEKKLITEKERKRKQSETADDKDDSLKDKDKDPKEDGNEADRDRPKKPKKPTNKDKQKTEQVKKSDTNEDLQGLLEVVLKSYTANVEAQNAMLAKLDAMETAIASMQKERAEAFGVEEVVETTSKSLEEINKVSEPVEDKAVSYVAKSAVDVEAPVEEQEATETKEEEKLFDVQRDRQKFLERFKKEARSGDLGRVELSNYQEAYYRASQGQATEDDLARLHGFIN